MPAKRVDMNPTLWGFLQNEQYAIFYASFIGAAALLLPALLEGLFEQVPLYLIADWWSLFYLGFFGTVIGFVWYYQGIQTIGPTRAGLFINFVPISAVIMAFLILHEPLTWPQVAGVLLVDVLAHCSRNRAWKCEDKAGQYVASMTGDPSVNQ